MKTLFPKTILAISAAFAVFSGPTASADTTDILTAVENQNTTVTTSAKETSAPAVSDSGTTPTDNGTTSSSARESAVHNSSNSITSPISHVETPLTSETAALTSGPATFESLTTPTESATAETSYTLPDGVQIQEIKKGSGPITTGTQTVLVHYEAFLTNGKKVDSSRTQLVPNPMKLTYGQGETVKGFEEGIMGMRVGAVRRIYVPADLAYGKQSRGDVPANSAMIFNVELVDISKSPAPPADSQQSSQ